MQRPSFRFLTITTFATATLIVLSACGGSQPSPQAESPTAAAQPPAAAPVEPQTPPPSDAAPHVAQSAPDPVAASHAPKPLPRPQATPSRQAEPVPLPKPDPVAKTIASGTDLEVELIDGASSKTSQVGSVVRARVTKAILVDGFTVVPEGSVIDGTVTEAVPLKKIGGAASLGLRFDTLELVDGTKLSIAAGIHEVGKSETGKDAGTIAGATAGGALLGRLLSKNSKTKGTLIGAAVGAAAGTGAAAATKGQEVELAPGTHVALQLEAPLTITVQP